MNRYDPVACALPAPSGSGSASARFVPTTRHDAPRHPRAEGQRVADRVAAQPPDGERVRPTRLQGLSRTGRTLVRPEAKTPQTGRYHARSQRPDPRRTYAWQLPLRALPLALLSLFCIQTARAQSPAPDAFNPGASNVVFALALHPDGRILASGQFLGLGGDVRNRLARLDTNGVLDAGFNPNANSDVNTLVVQPDDRILVGGGFTVVGGQTRFSIARLNASGSVDTNFNPNANGISTGYGNARLLSISYDLIF